MAFGALKMLPCLPARNAADMVRAHAKEGGDGMLIRSIGNESAYLYHVGPGQPGPVVALPVRKIDAPASPFCFSVERVIQVGPDEKVIRPKTRWVIASMAHAKIVRDWPHRDPVGDSVDPLLSLPYSGSSVSLFVQSARPLHAGIILRNGLQQLIEQIKSAMLTKHLEALQWLRCMGSVALKRCGASLILPQISAVML